jgi:hypothetical protein
MGGVILPEPSALASPYMSLEEQGLPMATEIVGPPAYGSPDPVTSAGKLLPLRDHPLRSDALPEGHPARIADDYGADHTEDYVMPGESSAPVVPKLLDLNTQQSETDEMQEVESYDEVKKDVLLAEAENRGLTVSKSMTKSEIIEALEADDRESAESESDE